MAESGTTAPAKRAYHSPARQRQAEESHRRMLAAARTLFAQRGYAGTTLEAIAEAAAVSPKTVGARFGSKRAILAEVLDPHGPGSRHAEVFEQFRAAPDPRAQLRLVARLTRDVFSASVPEFELLRGAGAVASELADVAAAVERRRRQRQAGLIGLLRQQGNLSADRTDEEATDEMWALSSFDLYHLLVLQRGWTPDQYETWLGEMLAERLLAR
jgi:AcrR family transcriptional regulator